MTISADGSTFTFPDGYTQTTRFPVQVSAVAASGSAATITGISPSARIIWCGLKGITLSGTDNLVLWIGNSTGFPATASGAWSTANFSATGTAGVTGTGTNYIALTPASAATYAWTGIVQMQRLAEGATLGYNSYYCEWFLGSTNAVRTAQGAGTITIPANTTVDRVKLSITTTNTMSGIFSVTYA